MEERVGVVFWHAASRRSWKLRSSQSRKSIRTHTISMRGQLALNTVTHRRTPGSSFGSFVRCVMAMSRLGCAVCTVARWSDARCRDAPPDAVGESGRDRAKQPQGHRVQSRCVRRTFPRIPMRTHSSPARASIRGQAEGSQRYGADTTCGATAKPVRACLCTLHGITSPSRRTSHVQGECRVASECVDATCACASVSARGRFGSAVPHGRLV